MTRYYHYYEVCSLQKQAAFLNNFNYCRLLLHAPNHTKGVQPSYAWRNAFASLMIVRDMPQKIN
jgi:hypothetical protein